MDRTMLIDLVTRMKGDRSIRQMAADTDIAASYISGILKGNYTPSITILHKLMAKSQDCSVTIDMLIASITTGFYKEDDMQLLLDMISSINPVEIGNAIANENLLEWCNEIQNDILNITQIVMRRKERK